MVGSLYQHPAMEGKVRFGSVRFGQDLGRHGASVGVLK